LAESPEYVAVTPYVPEARPLTTQEALRTLPDPLTGTAPHAPRLKVTVPVGALPDTLAVNVTTVPTTDGFGDAVTAVDVTAIGGGAPPVDTCTVSALALADTTVTLIP